MALTFDHGIYEPIARVVAHTASGRDSVVAPGQVISVFGQNIGPAAPSTASADPATNRVPDALAGVEVWFDDRKSSLLCVSLGQINAVAPSSLTPGTVTRVVVRNGFQSAAPLELRVEESVPGLFTVNNSGTGPAAALNQDNTLNIESTPALPGSVVTLYGTGFGAMDPPVSDGVVTGSSAIARVRLPVRVEIGGVPALVEYAGQAPGLVAGVVQLNVRLNSATPVGLPEVVVVVGESLSQAGVTVFVG
ncbi:MAG: hypothetical protein H7039_19570 [Bryobacteraceae bacterium]|nr:hypothetical protein [Bryobacteraceae bacterium]